MKRNTFEQFDLVQITTTRHVKWMMDLPGNVPDPNGIWSIVCSYPQNGMLLIQKASALARIPAADVKKVANYEVESVFDKLAESGKKYLKPPNEEEQENG